MISRADQNERERFQTLLLLGCPGLGVHQLINALEKKGQKSFNRWSRHCLPALQDFLSLPSSVVSALSGLTFGQMASVHSSVSARLCKRRQMAHSGRGNRAGCCQTMAQRASSPLFREFTHLLRNINCTSKLGGMGQAGNGGGSGLASDRMGRLSQSPLSSAPDVCICTDTKIKISMKLD